MKKTWTRKSANIENNRPNQSKVGKKTNLAPEPTLGLLIVGPEVLAGVIPPHQQQPRVPGEGCTLWPRVPRQHATWQFYHHLHFLTSS